MAMKEVIAELPSHNRLMLGWLMVHMSHIVENVSAVCCDSKWEGYMKTIRATVSFRETC